MKTRESQAPAQPAESCPSSGRPGMGFRTCPLVDSGIQLSLEPLTYGAESGLLGQADLGSDSRCVLNSFVILDK